MSSNQFLLNRVDMQDINGVLLKIEESFNIKFEKNDFNEVKTFGQLCDVIHHKVKHEHADTCTTQHAFYKLRNAITTAKGIDRNSITTQTCLNDIFFEDDRLWLLTVIEQEIGVELNIFKIKDNIIYLLLAGFVASFAVMFFNWQIAAAGFVASLVLSLYAGKFGKELRVKTMGQLAEKMAREHYLKCRRDIATVNRKEISRKVQELFQHELDLEASVLTPQATFN